MSGMHTLEENIARLEAAAGRCREATREANSATKALNQARKGIRDDVRAEVTAIIEQAVETELAKYRGEINTAIESARANVEQQFVQLARLYLGAGGGDERSMPDMLRDLKLQRALHGALIPPSGGGR